MKLIFFNWFINKIITIKNIILNLIFIPTYIKIKNLYKILLKKGKLNEEAKTFVSLNIIEGITKENKPLICAFVGSNDDIKKYWINLLFKKAEVNQIGSFPKNNIYKIINNEYSNCSLILTEQTDITKFIKLCPKEFVLPNYTQSYIDISISISSFPGKVRRYFSNTRRIIKKNNLSYKITKSVNAQKEFYHHYYLPFIGQKHSESCRLLNFEDIFSETVPFEIIQIIKDSEVISAGVIHYRPKHVSYAFLGIKDGDMKYVKMGGLSSIYFFLIKRLHEMGHKKLFLGGSPPFLTHNLTHHKIRMNAKHDFEFDYSKQSFTSFKILELSEAVRTILVRGPFVFLSKKGEMCGAVWLGKNQFSSQKDFIKCCRLLLNFGMKKNYILELEKNTIPTKWFNDIPKSFNIIKTKKVNKRLLGNKS